ncbi:MAG: hypothetical protein R3310_04620, partial [Candidatus Competibacteraceae bacterium]|nr:hypothetical protein [Candidatus Competibacteraceae bacterium]
MRSIIPCLLMLVLWLAFPPPLFAQPWVQAPAPSAAPLVAAKSEEQLQARRQALAEEAEILDRLRRELRQRADNLPGLLEQLTADKVTEPQVEQARVDMETARLRLEDRQVDLTNTERRIRDLEQSIRELEAREQLLRNPATGDAEGAERAQELARTAQAIARLRQELELERRHRELILAGIELAQQRLALNRQWFNRLDELWRGQQERTRQAAQQDLEQQLRERQAALRAEAAQVAQQLQDSDLAASQRRLLESRLEILEGRSKLVEQQMQMARIGNDLARLEGLAAAGEVPLRELALGLEQLRSLTQELLASRDLLRRGLELARQQYETIDPNVLSGVEARVARQRRELLGELVKELEERLNQIQGLLDRTDFLSQRLENQYQQRLSENLFQRRQLPASAAQWQQLLQGIVSAPRTLLIQVRVSAVAALETMIAAGPTRWVGLAAVELVLLGLVLWAARTLAVTIERISQRTSSFLGNLSLVLLRLARRNLWGLGIAAALIAALWVAQVPQPGLGIILTLVLLYLGIKLPITLARLVLVSSRIPPEERRPQLYRQLILVLIAGGILAAMTILAHLSSLPPAVLDAFDRLFMLYLVLITPAVLRVRGFLYDKLAGRYGQQAWFIVLRLVLLVLPLSLTIAALLGVVGYVELAWTMAWLLVVFILVGVGWLVVRGLVSDLVV